MATRIQQRRDSASNWTSSNPVLAAGEIGIETDTKKIKVGDGASTWAALEYYVIPVANSTPRARQLSNTASGWNTANTVLYTAEIGIETDTGKMKIGDGNTAWSSLSYGPSVAGNPGSGFENMEVYTSGSGATWTLPTAANGYGVGARFKVTLIGGGGQGGGTAATAGQQGGGGASGGVVVAYITQVAGQTTATYTVGAAGSGAGTATAGTAGSSTTFVYNGVTYTAGGGGGGSTAATATASTGGTASGGTLNINGNPGQGGGTAAATNNVGGKGGDTPLGFGAGGVPGANATTSTTGSGYGSGGSGAHNGATATATAGGAGTAGIVIIEY